MGGSNQWKTQATDISMTGVSIAIIRCSSCGEQIKKIADECPYCERELIFPFETRGVKMPTQDMEKCECSNDEKEPVVSSGVNYLCDNCGGVIE